MTDIALVTTTINVPHLLGDYARDAKEHGRSVKMYVAGDRKTPAAAAELCADVALQTGIACEYMDVTAQNSFMRSYPVLDAHIPFNCVQRRNVAVLKAAVDQADVVVTIDDDNYLETADFFGAHSLAGSESEQDIFGTREKWFNICSFLAEQNGRQFFPRGYGLAARQAEPDILNSPPKKSMKAVVNAGLWLGDPDIDAVTRLAGQVNATGYLRKSNFFVAEGAWAPFNSQNTAIAREALPAYFLSPYVGRYDDIFISFIVKRIADHLGHGISFGQPLVRQNRNEHDLLHDLALELFGMKFTDKFVASLEKVRLSADNYAGCALELCNQSESFMKEAEGANMAERAKLAAFYSGCRIWAELPLW